MAKTPWLTKGDTILLTGGNGGLGKELVRIFAHAGFCVISIDRDYPAIEDKFDSVKYLTGDISSHSFLVECHKQIREEFGTVTVLINNAAVRPPARELVQQSPADIKRVNEVNCLGPELAYQVFLPDMVARQRGYIVNVASALGFLTPAGFTAYAASKAYLIALHEGITREIDHVRSETGADIRQLLILPGQINTKMFADTSTPSQLMAPILSPEALAAKIYSRVLKGAQGKVSAPFYVRFLPIMRTLPTSWALRLRNWSQVDETWKTAQEQARTDELVNSR